MSETYRFIIFEPDDDGNFLEIAKSNNLESFIATKDRLIIVDNKDKIIYILLDNENISIRLKVTLAWAAQQLHDKIGYPVANVTKHKLSLINEGKFSFRIDKKKMLKNIGTKLIRNDNKTH